MIKDFTLLSGAEVVKYQSKYWFKDEAFKLVNDKGIASYLVPDNRLEESSDSAIRELMDNFEWDKVHSIMSGLNWTWYGQDEPPTVEKMKELVMSLYSSIRESVEKNRKAFSSTGGFKLTYDPDEDGELSLIFEAVTYSVYTQ